jgi:hypothetical protein
MTAGSRRLYAKYQQILRRNAPSRPVRYAKGVSSLRPRVAESWEVALPPRLPWVTPRPPNPINLEKIESRRTKGVGQAFRLPVQRASLPAVNDTRSRPKIRSHFASHKNVAAGSRFNRQAGRLPYIRCKLPAGPMHISCV